MLGLPRTVIPPTDQIQGHVGGWRNGFFVNDVWQPSRNVTLSLGLRYELNTPVQTYEGLATMLPRISRRSSRDAAVGGLRVPRAELQGLAPRLGATYRLSEKTVVRAGFGIYYNPNQMNSFTFLTNNRRSRRDDLHVGPGLPDAVLRSSDRRVGPAGGRT